MSYSKSSKIKLLQSASALILGASAVTAHAQSVTTINTSPSITDVTVAATVDALVVVDQSVSASSGTTATANDANNTSGNGADVTNSSVSITGSTTAATAINNTSSQSLNDFGAATTTRTSGISVEQDNLSSATAQTGVAVDGSDVTISTGTTQGSPLTISGSVNRASATGNTASTAVSTTDFTTNSTQATLGAMQQNLGVTSDATNAKITATVNDTNINLQAGATTTSDLTVSGNTDAAVATANSLTQRMTLDGTTLTLGTGSASLDTVAAATIEVTAVTFTGLAANQSYTFAGRTVTTGATVMTDAQVAAAFATGTTAIAGATVTGTLSGTLAAGAGTLVTHTAAANGAKTDLVVTATGGAVAPTASVTTAGTTTFVDAAGPALLSSRQSNTFTDVSAANTASSIKLVAGVTDSSSLDLTGNMQDATATGSTAGNVLALSGTTVGTGGGIVSTQTSDAESSVTAATTGQAGISVTSLGATTASSASLTDNMLQSRATGGSVTNRLTADATTITLKAADNTDAAIISNSAVTDDSSLGGVVSAAFATLNDQLISGAVTATTDATATAAGFTVATTGAGLTNGSSVNNDRNAMTAQAQGAVAANTTILAVGGTLSQASAGTTEVANAAVIANIQELASGATVSATVDTTATQAVLTSITGVLSSSSVSTSNNRVQASADGASASNALTASATTLTTPAGSTATPGSTGQTANAAFAVVNSQDSGTGAVDAKLTDSLTVRTAITGTVTASSVDSIGNVQEALASSNKAANSLALSATTLNSNGAILNNQESDAPVTSTIGMTGADAGVVIATAAVVSSGIALTDTLVRGSATGNVATNTQNIAATTLTLNSPDTALASTITGLAGTVKGAFSTLSDQKTVGDVQATTIAGFNVAATGSVTNGSSINNDRNAMTAQAQGAVAANTTTLSVGGTLSQGTTAAGAIANAAVIANIQELADAADVLARVDTGSSTAAMLTKVGAALTSSSVSTSNNRIQAIADGASATNALAASATTLTTAANATGVPGSTALTADAAFAVVNRQDGGSGTIAAELNNPIPLRTEIVGATSSSSVTSTGNMQDAFATSNKATNSITLAATTLTSDGAVVNNQNSEARVSSIIGVTGTTAGATGVNAGVIIDLDDTITGSNIAVTGNIVRGSAISNVGTNTLTASATTLAGDGTDAKATADADGLVTNADFSLGNSQTLDAAATAATKVYATYGVDVLFDKTITNSQIAVSNNTQFGEALGNSATNRVQLTAVQSGVTGTGNDPTAALNNVQSGLTADIGATSDMSLYANMASSGSSVALNGNSNTSLGAINNAANTVSVSGLAVNGSTDLASVDVSTNVTTADYALNNNQDASGVLTSTAKTTAYNLDRYIAGPPAIGDQTTTGISNGSASLSRNTTTAEASSNRVTNSLAVSATDIGATAALGNEQSSAAGVTATASSSTYKLDLTTAIASTYAANGSSVAVEGNTTTALARGNSASNALNYNVNVAYTGIATVPTFAGTTAASAGAVVLNAQTNTGGVAANADSVVYAVGLAGAVSGTSGSALNSSASLGNNTTSAAAFGNAATNTLTMATWSAGIPSSAISSNQVNGGAVTATATGVGFTMTPTGAASGSMFRNSGNSISAQAIGNSSVSTIGGGN